jgi:hypothetical protein
MSYDLQAEGINGTHAQTTVVALPEFTSEFNIAVWNVDGTKAPAIDAIHGFTAKGAAGVVGQSDGDGGTGVAGVGTGTGVSGRGNIYGGVFHTTPPAGAKTFANIQLTPVKSTVQDIAITHLKGSNVTPQLPDRGAPGDVLALSVPSDPDGVKLWVCIKPPDAVHGATWARVSFDAAITTRKL